MPIAPYPFCTCALQNISLRMPIAPYLILRMRIAGVHRVREGDDGAARHEAHVHRRGGEGLHLPYQGT